jgi:hypothetical protein
LQKLDASNENFLAENFLAKSLAKKLAKNNDGKLEAVTSIKSLRGHVLNDQLVNPPSETNCEYTEVSYEVRSKSGRGCSRT